MILLELGRRTIIAGIAAAALTLPACAQKQWKAPPVVTNYCSGCHGVDGNTQTPYFPRLAGLDPVYARKKLQAFKETKSPASNEIYSWLIRIAGKNSKPGNVTQNERINMEGVAHAASADAENSALLWYAKQVPEEGRSGNRVLVDEGRELFRHGVPAQKILACMSCHGANAQGQASAPRLAGQNAQYIEIQLNKFRRGDRQHAPEMTMVTRDLDPGQAHAVAAYLQSQ